VPILIPGLTLLPYSTEGIDSVRRPKDRANSTGSKLNKATPFSLLLLLLLRLHQLGSPPSNRDQQRQIRDIIEEINEIPQSGWWTHGIAKIPTVPSHPWLRPPASAFFTELRCAVELIIGHDPWQPVQQVHYVTPTRPPVRFTALQIQIQTKPRPQQHHQHHQHHHHHLADLSLGLTRRYLRHYQHLVLYLVCLAFVFFALLLTPFPLGPRFDPQ
jgi:hypothetical protein